MVVFHSFLYVCQRVNLHFPMVFLWFSYVFPICRIPKKCPKQRSQWLICTEAPCVGDGTSVGTSRDHSQKFNVFGGTKSSLVHLGSWVYAQYLYIYIYTYIYIYVHIYIYRLPHVRWLNPRACWLNPHHSIWVNCNNSQTWNKAHNGDEVPE